MSFKIRRDLLITLINAACAVVCAMLAGCKLALGELSIKDLESSLDFNSVNSVTNIMERN